MQSPNILLGPDWKAKIADTGLARTLVNRTHFSQTTLGGTFQVRPWVTRRQATWRSYMLCALIYIKVRDCLLSVQHTVYLTTSLHQAFLLMLCMMRM